MQWYLCQILAKERWDVHLKNWISLVESINSSPWSKLQEHPIFSSSALHRVTSKQASGWHFWSVGVAYPSLAITAHLWHICTSANCTLHTVTHLHTAHCTSVTHLQISAATPPSASKLLKIESLTNKLLTVGGFLRRLGKRLDKFDRHFAEDTKCYNPRTRR